MRSIVIAVVVMVPQTPENNTSWEAHSCEAHERAAVDTTTTIHFLGTSTTRC